MAKKKAQKGRQNEGRRKSSLFIERRVDSLGRNYYIDKNGDRRSGAAYQTQYGEKGRVDSETFRKALREVERYDIRDKDEVKLIVRDFQVMKKADEKRKREIEFTEKAGTNLTRYWDVKDLITQNSGFKINILTPTGTIFYNYSEARALEIVEKFGYETNKLLRKLIAEKKIDYGILEVNTNVDFENETIEIDLKNIEGLKSKLWVNQFIKQNFENPTK